MNRRPPVHFPEESAGRHGNPVAVAKFRAKAGIIGWAQVQGRNALSWRGKLALDTQYVDNASPRLDFEGLLRTI